MIGLETEFPSSFGRVLDMLIFLILYIDEAFEGGPDTACMLNDQIYHYLKVKKQGYYI